MSDCRRSETSSVDSERGLIYWSIIAAALLARVYICFFSGKEWFSADSYGYFNLADAILAGKPFAYTPNGYPLLVAAVKLLTKAQWVPVVLIGINIFASVVVVALVMRIAGVVHPSLGVGYAAGVVSALLPSQVNYVRYLYSEVPATALFTYGIALLLAERHVASGLLLFVSNLFRSTLGPVIPLAAICVVSLKRNWRGALLLLAGALLGLLLYRPLEWARVVSPPGNFGGNVLLAIGDKAEALGMSGSDDYHRNVSVVERYVAFAVDHPREYLRDRLAMAWDLWGPWPPAGDAPGRRPRSTVSRLLTGLRFPLLLLAVLGFVRWRRSFSVWICAVPIVVISATHILLYSEARYTYTVEPLAIVLAVLGGHSLLHRVTRNRRLLAKGVETSADV